MDVTQLSNQVALALAKLRTHVVSLEKKLEEKEEDFEEKAIQYVYEHTGEYDDWVKDSSLYQELEAENKKLKKKFEVLNSVQEEFRKQLRKEMDILLKDNDKKLKVQEQNKKQPTRTLSR